MTTSSPETVEAAGSAEMADKEREVTGSKISVVVPAFNEAENLGPLHQRLAAVMTAIGCDYEVVFVDDGSTDSSLAVMREICEEDGHCGFVSFTRNFGHESATSAGLAVADGDAVVIIDADLQDPPEVIEQMVDLWSRGNDVVYGRRRKRPDEPRLKRCSSYLFYRVLRRIAEIDIPLDTGDFRLMDRRMVDFFNDLREKNRFVRGEIAWLGGRTEEVIYDREPRHAGETKYDFFKRLRLSLDSIVSFSVFPLRLMSVFGLIIFALSLVGALVVLIQRVFFTIQVPGYAFLIIVVFFLGGIQMLFLGLVGEYLSRIYIEVKDRPLYLVSSTGGFKERSGYGTGTVRGDA